MLAPMFAGKVTRISYQRMGHSPKRIAERWQANEQLSHLEEEVGLPESQYNRGPRHRGPASEGEFGAAEDAELCKNGGDFG